MSGQRKWKRASKGKGSPIRIGIQGRKGQNAGGGGGRFCHSVQGREKQKYEMHGKKRNAEKKGADNQGEIKGNHSREVKEISPGSQRWRYKEKRGARDKTRKKKYANQIDARERPHAKETQDMGQKKQECDKTKNPRQLRELGGEKGTSGGIQGPGQTNAERQKGKKNQFKRKDNLLGDGYHFKSTTQQERRNSGGRKCRKKRQHKPQGWVGPFRRSTGKRTARLKKGRIRKRRPVCKQRKTKLTSGLT